MSDYAIEGGAFLRACQALITREFRISWYDRFPAPELVTMGQQSQSMQLGPAVGGGSTPAQSVQVSASLVVKPSDGPKPALNKSNRIKFTCGCGQNIWGKPSLKVLCMACNTAFEALEDGATEPQLAGTMAA